MNSQAESRRGGQSVDLDLAGGGVNGIFPASAYVAAFRRGTSSSRGSRESGRAEPGVADGG